MKEYSFESPVFVLMVFRMMGATLKALALRVCWKSVDL